MGEVLNTFGKNQMMLSIFIDLKKAFDAVPHYKLLRKMECLNVTDVELQWFESYLSGHMQRVSLGSSLSAPAP